MFSINFHLFVSSPLFFVCLFACIRSFSRSAFLFTFKKTSDDVIHVIKKEPHRTNVYTNDEFCTALFVWMHALFGMVIRLKLQKLLLDGGNTAAAVAIGCDKSFAVVNAWFGHTWTVFPTHTHTAHNILKGEFIFRTRKFRFYRNNSHALCLCQSTQRFSIHTHTHTQSLYANLKSLLTNQQIPLTLIVNNSI